MNIETKASFKDKVRNLYTGASVKSRTFRYCLLGFDIGTIILFIIFSMFDHTAPIIMVELVIALIIFTDFVARLWISNNRGQYMYQLTAWLDIIVIISLILPLLMESFAFLRVMRAVRLLRSYHILNDLRKHSLFFKRHEAVIQSTINLFVFIFTVTALVYVFQVRTNPQISTYLDALYFTVTTLTTTGFGDITLQGDSGRILSVLIMVIGVALFLRLVQTIFRPAKVEYSCPDCGLSRHDPDAIHCKHCGKVIKITTEGMN